MSVNTSYALLKYSRSYPLEDAARIVAQPTSADSEWQHFVNPTLHFLSEVIGPNGLPRAVRLHITWPLVGGNEPQPTSQGYVVLEDIDLLSFPSTSKISRLNQKAQIQSLPLKVVYRDSVVGFRYLHPLVTPAGSPTTYRRFQISFTDPLTATKFVDSIRQICPCKASPPPAAILGRGMATQPVHTTFSTLPKRANITNDASFPVPVQLASSQILVPSTLDLTHNLKSQWPSPRPRVIQSDSRMPPVTPTRTHTAIKDPHTMLSIHREFQTPMFDRAALSSSAASPLKAPLQLARRDSDSYISSSPCVAHSLHGEYVGHDGAPVGETAAPRASQTVPAPFSNFAGPSSAFHIRQPHVTSVVPAESTTAIEPSMSNPSVSFHELRNHNPNDSSTSSSHPQSSFDLTRDLRAVKELYSMPIGQLEKLVGEVVREPGFLPLLEKLDTMWKVKGFINKD